MRSPWFSKMRLTTIARWLLLILGVSVFVGGFLFHLLEGLDRLPTQWPALLWDVYFALIYTVVMFGCLSGTGHALQAHVPLQSQRAVALHAGGLAAAAAGSYGLATALCWGLYPSVFRLSWEILVVTGTIAFLVTLIWSAFTYLIRFYQQMQDVKTQRYEARLQALRAQINPHFLFNAFNSIAALIRTRPEEAETVVEDLADLFRYTLHASKQDVSSLRDELQAVQRYLAIEKARFRDRLRVEMDVPDSLQSVSVPSMTLQPLVENAVKHGARQTQEPCTITVVANRENGTLCLRVTDTGPGFDTTDLDAVLDGGSGLANVRERLQLFFGEDAQMEVLGQGIALRLPIEDDPGSPLEGGPPSSPSEWGSTTAH